MRIAFLADPLDNQQAGIYVYTKGILQALTALDQTNEYIIVRPESKASFPNTKEIIVPINSWMPMHSRVRQFTSIPYMVAQEGVDMVIEPAHFGPFNLPKRIKRVTVMHDMTPIIYPEYHSPMSHWMHRLFLPNVIKKAKLIIAVSESTRKDLVDYYPQAKDKTQVVLEGKDEDFKPQRDASVLKKHKITKPYFLSVSTLEPRKNLGLLVEAYHRFRNQSNADVQLVLAGKKGWNIDDLLNKINHSPYKADIILTGFTDKEDMPTLYTMSLAFVFPSWYEGFGIPVLEAMSCGTVAIISNVSSLPEVGGEAALYFSPHSVAELTHQLEKVYHEEELSTKHKALSLKQASQFTWERAALETKKLIDQL